MVITIKTMIKCQMMMTDIRSSNRKKNTWVFDSKRSDIARILTQRDGQVAMVRLFCCFMNL